MFTKFALAVILLVIAAGIFAACKPELAKNLMERLKRKSPKDENLTIILPDLFLLQFGANGGVVYEHGIKRSQMRDPSGTMVGISVGHPCYDDEEPNTLSLFGRKVKNKFNQQDPDTYNAFTVHRDSFLIGFDDEGFYGEVIHPDVVVVRYEANGNTKEFKCGEFFEIKPDLNVKFRIGKQCFGFKDPHSSVTPHFDSIPSEETSSEGMGDIFGRRGIRSRR